MIQKGENMEFVKKNIAKEYLFVRYMGPKFVVVFSGIDTDSVTSFIDDLKKFSNLYKTCYLFRKRLY